VRYLKGPAEVHGVEFARQARAHQIRYAQYRLTSDGFAIDVVLPL
jgi:hypothetical protein